VALLAQPQRGDAAAEAGADDQPVVVVVMHGPASVAKRVTGASGFTAG
jgi:hypothetical protein